MADKVIKDFVKDCNEYITKRWNNIVAQIEENKFRQPPIADDLKEMIRIILRSGSKTYHYVLPTQILAKVVQPEVDCRSVQVSYKGKGAFDARTIAHKVIVPFDKNNSNVLGGSIEPYVNNPLRIPAIIAEYRSQQKAKEDWDRLVVVLRQIEARQDKNFTAAVFDFILYEIHQLLQDVSIQYPKPGRISLTKTLELVNKFLNSHSGGNNEEIIASALLKTLANHFKMFEKVESSNVNSADTSTGKAADIECFINGEVALLVEVKDKFLTVAQIENKLENARAKSITEILFLAQNGIAGNEQAEVGKAIEQEFNSGQNIYICSIIDFSLGLLMLLGEKGRVEFLNEVGLELNARNSAMKHRKGWAMLLRSV